MFSRVGIRIIGLTVAIALVVVIALAWDTEPLVQLRQGITRDGIAAWVDRAGLWGPVLVIGLMTVAVVASPIPSAPIALAAGAAYGHTMGTIYILIGAQAGAMIAFALARILGRAVLLRWFGNRVDAGLLGSQNALTATVFASRLMPFVSFDMISYAAGLSCLHFWRFILATLAGIIPAAFLLAHFGNQAVGADMGRATWVVLGLGLVTGAPILWVALTRSRKAAKADRNIGTEPRSGSGTER